MQSSRRSQKILARYAILKNARAVADELNVSHNTVLRVVRAHADATPARGPRPSITDAHRGFIKELITNSGGKIRADVVHEALLDRGFEGSQRTTRRIVATLKQEYCLSSSRRAHQPWVTAPGKWLQYDFGDGPVVDGKKTVLFVAWVAYSRFRVVFALRNRKMTTVLAALDRCFRAIGGVPDFVLTDNEKTVVVGRHAGLPEFNPTMESFMSHYRVSIQVCAPADPATKGGVEYAVRLAKDDILPRDTNLVDAYETFGQLEAACQAFMDKINARPHRTTGLVPAEVLREVEAKHLGPLPVDTHPSVFGELRKVPANTPMITYQQAVYSVPEELMGRQVYITEQSSPDVDEVVIYFHDIDGVEEVARHVKGARGDSRIDPSHFSFQRPEPGHYKVNPRSKLEKDFLAIGPGAEAWLRFGVAHHAPQIKHTMSLFVTLAATCGKWFADDIARAAIDAGLITSTDIKAMADNYPVNALAAKIGTAFDIEGPEPETIEHASNSWDGFYTPTPPETSHHEADEHEEAWF